MATTTVYDLYLGNPNPSFTGSTVILASNGNTNGDDIGLTLNKIKTFCTSDTIPVVKGGTGLTGFTANSFLNISSGATLQERTLSQYKSDLGLSTVASSGAYADLSGKPTIPSAYTLPTGTTSVMGGIIVGSGLTITTAGVLSSNATSYNLTTGTTTVLGGVKVGSGLTITTAGVLSSTATGGVDALLTVADLATYARGIKETVIVTDLLRGGTFVYKSTGLTADNGVVFTAAGGGFWQRIYQGAVNLAWFGLIDDPAGADEATAINQRTILNDVFWDNKYNNYYIPAGTYWVSGHNSGNDKNSASIPLQSNTNIVMDSRCIIRMLTNTLSTPIIFYIRQKHNIVIEGGQLYGDRYYNINTDDFGFGIYADAAIDLTIKDTIFRDFKADGIYVSGGESVFLNPTVPVTQTFTALPNKEYRVDLVGTGSIDLSYSGTTFATVTADSCRHLFTPNVVATGITITATLTTGVTFFCMDSPSYNVYIDNVETNNARRNGISIICCVNWILSNSLLCNSKGVDPQAGLDLEPNIASQRIWNGRVENVDALDNYNYGIIVTGHNIVVENCNVSRNKNGNGYWFANANLAGGDVFINNCTANYNATGFAGAGGIKLSINGLTIRDCTTNIGCTLSGFEEVVGNNIIVQNSSKEGLEITNTNGRVSLNNVVVDGAGKGTSGVGMNVRGSNTTISNFRVLNCGYGGVATSAAQTNVILANGHIEGSQRTGLLVASNNTIVSNTIVQGNGIGNSSSYMNIDVTGSYNKIMNNVTKKGTPSPRYGIRVTATATGTTVINNDVELGGSLGNFQDLGVGTIHSLSLQGNTQVSANYTQVYNDEFIAVTGISAPFNVTLLAASLWKGKTLTIKDESGTAATNNVTVVGTIEGTANRVINTNFGILKLYSNGTSILIR